MKEPVECLHTVLIAASDGNYRNLGLTMPEARKTCIAAGNILKLHEPDRQWHNVIIYQAHIKAVYC